MSARSVWIVVVVCGSLAGCARSPGWSSSRSTLAAVALAAGRGDYATLYRLLPAQARRAESEGAFAARLRSDETELRELAGLLTQRLGGTDAPVAMVPLTVGDAAWLSESSAGFGLSHPGFGASAAPTPVDALRSFRSALARSESGSLDEVLSASARGAMQAQVRSLLEALRDPSSLVITSTTQGASARLSDGRLILLVRENDRWRVDEVRDGAR